MGWDYQADLSKHESQTDAAKGFGGKFGVQKVQDKVGLYCANYDQWFNNGYTSLLLVGIIRNNFPNTSHRLMLQEVLEENMESRKYRIR